MGLASLKEFNTVEKILKKRFEKEVPRSQAAFLAFETLKTLQTSHSGSVGRLRVKTLEQLRSMVEIVRDEARGKKREYAMKIIALINGHIALLGATGKAHDDLSEILGYRHRRHTRR